MKKRFELSQTQGVSISTQDLIADMKDVAVRYSKETLTYRWYEKMGKYSSDTILKRFGSWNIALEKADLGKSNELYITQDLLFENIENLWIKLGRQPRKRDLSTSLSKYSISPYKRLFRNWRGALEKFVAYMDSLEEAEGIYVHRFNEKRPQARRNRDPSLRLRFLVMRRDSFKCQHCGRSPANHANVELHIDHIKPWSKGGETTLDNLKTLCNDCNLGKGILLENC